MRWRRRVTAQACSREGRTEAVPSAGTCPVGEAEMAEGQALRWVLAAEEVLSSKRAGSSWEAGWWERGQPGEGKEAGRRVRAEEGGGDAASAARTPAAASSRDSTLMWVACCWEGTEVPSW